MKHRRSFLNINSRTRRRRTTFGRPAIGRGRVRATIGFPERGRKPPQTGLYWTPGYWGENANGPGFAWNPGYWAPQVGFYGGINYGYGYFGNGYQGGRWEPNGFAYNTAVSNVNRTIITNTYVDRTVVKTTVYQSRELQRPRRRSDTPDRRSS